MGSGVGVRVRGRVRRGPRVCAAPTNSERMRTPWFFCWHAMYSKAISHMPWPGRGRGRVRVRVGARARVGAGTSRSEVMISASARK